MLWLIEPFISNHAYAKHIPPFLLFQLWGHHLSDDAEAVLVARMSGSLTACSFVLTKRENPLKALLSVAYAHPVCSDEELIEAARRMRVPSKVLISAAMILGRRSFFTNPLLCPIERLTVLREADYQVIYLASYRGDSDLVRELTSFLTVVDCWDLLKSKNYRIIFLFQEQHLKEIMVPQILALFKPEELVTLIASDGYKLIDLLLERADPVRTFEILYQFLGETLFQTLLSADQYRIFRRLSKHFDENAFDFLLSLLTPEKILSMFAAKQFALFRNAIKHTTLDLVDFSLHLITEPSQRDNMLKAGFQAGFVSYTKPKEQEAIFERLLEHAPHFINDLRHDLCLFAYDKIVLNQLKMLLMNQFKAFLDSRKATVPLLELKVPAPHLDYCYELPCSDLPEGKLTVTYGGLSPLKVSEFTVNYLNQINYNHGYPVFPMSYESSQTLPLSFLDLKIPLYFYLPTEGSLYPIANIHVYNNALIVPLSSAQGPAYRLKAINEELRETCQLEAGSIPVKSGKHPIFEPANRPGLEPLSALYRAFWRYNKDRVTWQFSVTSQQCHVRAHFLSTLLSLIGIDSVKVYKLWGNNDWRTFTGMEAWEFHCAVMVFDQDNRAWIWDPWIKNTPYMPSLKEWIYDSQSPVPREIIVHNRAVIDYQSRFPTVGIIPSPGLDCRLSIEYFDYFQAMWTNAIPNPPQPTPKLRMNRHSFFSHSGACSSSTSDTHRYFPTWESS
jgi:hypothetical protein